MTNWFSRHLVLVAGVTLPALLLVGFLLLQSTQKALVDPPAYDFLVVAYHYDVIHPGDSRVSFQVQDGKLQGRATPYENHTNGHNDQVATLYRYSVSDDSFAEVLWDEPEAIQDLQETLTFNIPELDEFVIDEAVRSPDGYKFEFLPYANRGLIGTLFDMDGGRRNDYSLEKDGVVFPLPRVDSTHYYYGKQIKFVGWLATTGAPS